MRRTSAPAWERHGLVILVPDPRSSERETACWPPTGRLDRPMAPVAVPSWQAPCGCPDDCPRDHQAD